MAKDLFGEEIIEDVILRDKFLEPPFSVLDTRQSSWLNRKRKWERLGIESEMGRDKCLTMIMPFGKYQSREEYKEEGEKVGTSTFDPALTELMYNWFCPLAGGGTRGFVATAMGHYYYGIELRQNEVERIYEQMKKLNTFFDIICGDSQEFTSDANGFDFCYTCPPYYDLEVYSSLPNDLSNAKTYNDFLNMMLNCLKGIYKALKPGGLAVLVVGNFRRTSGDLVHFNGDMVRLGLSIGFKLWDELIFWAASGNAAQRAGMFEANRKAVRVHEYIIILKK
jgi:SAM-dependent methyltransferase